ncbi:ras-specific guanine nucleotide-releasing factor 1 isoform X1, partial [Silurus meridionalis]
YHGTLKLLSGFLTSVSFTAKSDKNSQDLEHLDFKIVVEPKDSQSFTIILVASSRQEKSAWTSDISQVCLPA